METELLEVLYNYEYDYKEKKISIVSKEKLKLLQRTNQHWWKVVRPGVNKAFFVPAQYVQTVTSSPRPPSAAAVIKKEDNQLQAASTTNPAPVKTQIESHSRQSSTSSEHAASGSTENLTTQPPSTSATPLNNGHASKMKRTDSARASKRALKVKNWSASLEELSKQIVFPGLAAESVMNLSSTGAPIRNSHQRSESASAAQSSSSQQHSSSKPIPMPRKSSTEGVIGGGAAGNISSSPAGEDGACATPKPIPKARSKTILSQRSSSGNKSSGGSSEILTSNEDLLVGRTAAASTRDNYKASPTPSPDMKSLSTFTGAATTSSSNSPSPRPTSTTSTSTPDPRKPNPPTPDNRPIRLLLDNWAEYLTPENRLFYYNEVTGSTSWKPPRVNSMRHDSSFEDSPGRVKGQCQGSSPNVSLSASAATGKSTDGSTGGSPVPSLSLTEDAALPVPEGWTCSLDEGSGQFCYVNQVSGAKWFSSQDPAGKIYYYEENSNKSSWFLPVPGIALNEDHQNPSSPLSKSTTLESMEPRESTPPKLMPDVLNLVKKRHSTGDVADRFLKARSLVILDPSRKSSEAANVKNSSLPRSPNARSIWSSSSGIDSELVVIKESSLSRTKITENAKKLRKNWSTVYVVLTEEHLSLFKDQKSFTNSSSRKPEIEIPLYGSSVERVTEKSSRKNVFQLNAERGTLQILFQTDELKLAEEWIETLEEVIGEQEQVKTEDNYSLRLCSTSPDTFLDHPIGEKKNARLGRAKSTKVKITGSVENLSMEEKHKIKAQLKKFFNRRPPRESLVKKGIYKDESVFGCHLDKLCARESQSVPRFVQECIAVIESKPENLKTDGIYRASGNLSQVQKIRLQVDQNNLTCLVQEEDVHVLAGSLKLFFREMKEPLIPTNMFQRALEASSLPSRKDKLNSFRDLVSRLDKPNKSTLCLLLKHLLKVSEFADFNRMLIPNLAIVFGPTLMWPAQESTNMALDLMQQNLVVEALLLDFNSIFER